MNFKKIKLTIFFSFIILFIGCEETLVVKDPYPISNTDFIYFQSSKKLFFSTAIAKTFNGFPIDTVMILWKGDKPDSSISDTVGLFDDGSNGDIIENDKIYSVEILNSNFKRNSLSNSPKDSINFTVLAKYGQFTLPEDSNSFALGNLKPRISYVTLPDTVTAPDSSANQPNATQFLVEAKVYDPNGLSDIKRVFFTSYYSTSDDSAWTVKNGGNPIFLYDDGSIGSFSGDLVKLDSIYSVTVSLNSRTTPGKYKWIFKAQDLSNEYSAELDTTLIVR